MAPLSGIRVLEIADQHGEYLGRTLASLGADVIKIEPPGGEVTRRLGPFAGDPTDPEQSLHFRYYNLGKRSVVASLDTSADRAHVESLLETADVLIDSRASGPVFRPQELEGRWPHLIHVRVSPFGDEGPWSTFVGSDLVHLALGGVVMNCGYDPDPTGAYDTPPVAPQGGQAYHIAGDQALIGVLGALRYKRRTGVGQRVAVSVHHAVSQSTELDLPSWIYNREERKRQTARHSSPQSTERSIAMTKDGRWLATYRTYLQHFLPAYRGNVALLSRFGMQNGLDAPECQEEAKKGTLALSARVSAAVDALVQRFPFARDLWRDAQELGMSWAPVRSPEENLHDPHWQERDTFATVLEQDLGTEVRYPLGRWFSEDSKWAIGAGAPRLGAHSRESWHPAEERASSSEKYGSPLPSDAPAHADGSDAELQDWPLAGVRVVDLSWVLASGGAGRFLAALGAEVIKVEHDSRLDGYRNSVGLVPPGGREERDRATSRLTPERTSINQSGAFLEANAGKRSFSLNLKSDRGLEILTRLVEEADVLIEGFSPGTLARLGFSSERLRELNPRLVYVAQSGMGAHGSYGDVRTYGPSAQAFSGLTEMSGLPDPYPPAGIGYSYLDWYGAYNMASAVLAGLYQRDASGQGVHLDLSQVEIGLVLAGLPIVDYQVNGRPSARQGNRPSYLKSAPHNVYPVAGDDRWIAITCMTDTQWRSLVEVLGSPAWADDPAFASMDGRLRDVDRLDSFIAEATRGWDGNELMMRLQAEAVPAGICQTAADRCDSDPQLWSDRWMAELDQIDMGRWPVRDVAFRLSRTPARIGGMLRRSGPSYGQDNNYVLRDVLGLTEEEIADLATDGAL
ncbi:CoA transferase [Microbacterium sp. A196]|uniref:CaiB/BaiF CoA-transferase family protein n=1 Tax=unclassified Microbacterium TaxID=2609290 RepID=UPI003F40FE9D